MTHERLFAMPFSDLYPLYVAKAERKGRTRVEVDAVILWLTGYDIEGLRSRCERPCPLSVFFAEAPLAEVRTALVRGTVCGVRVETVEDPLLRRIRALDRLVDELARGVPLPRILR